MILMIGMSASMNVIYHSHLPHPVTSTDFGFHSRLRFDGFDSWRRLQFRRIIWENRNGTTPTPNNLRGHYSTELTAIVVNGTATRLSSSEYQVKFETSGISDKLNSDGENKKSIITNNPPKDQRNNRGSHISSVNQRFSIPNNKATDGIYADNKQMKGHYKEMLKESTDREIPRQKPYYSKREASDSSTTIDNESKEQIGDDEVEEEESDDMTEEEEAEVWAWLVA